MLRSHGAARGVCKSKKVNLDAGAVGAAMVTEMKANEKNNERVKEYMV